jgi:signal transduction histidine kinase
MMPCLDGFGLLRELRADAVLQTLPVILLSARAGEEGITSVQEGADDYLIKPFSARELMARVAAHLKLARLRKHSEAAIRESALREKQIELARVLRALSLGELATSIAHEVNQPLAGVVSNAEAGLRWLSYEVPKIDEARESLAMIAEDGVRAAEVIRRLRDFLNKGKTDHSPIDLTAVIREAVALTRVELVKRHIDVRLELEADLPPIPGDRIQLQQVILNLIMNGAEAIENTAEVKEIVVTSRLGDGGILVAVRDSGTGIRAEDMPRMFDAFFTTKPAGMGMGLSISRSILEMHGGRIWAERNEGPGITVQFSLPAQVSGQQSSTAGR